MELSLKRGTPRNQKTACIIVAIYSGKVLGDEASDIDKASRGAVGRIVRRGDLTGKLAHTVVLPDVKGIEGERVLLVGAGKRSGIDPDEYRRLIKNSADKLKQYESRNVVSTLLSIKVHGRDTLWKLDQHVLIFSESNYRFDELKSKKIRPGLRQLGFLCDNEPSSVVRRAIKVSRAKMVGVNFMKTRIR